MLASNRRPTSAITRPRAGAGTAAHSRWAARAARQASAKPCASVSSTSATTSDRLAGLVDSSRPPGASVRSAPSMIDAAVRVEVTVSDMPITLSGRSRQNGPRMGRHRSLWLREALGDAPPAPPLEGAARADVAILGGGFVGLWTALRIKERDPACDVVVLERDVCGGGASGRNGGMVLTWWPKLSSLIARCGAEEAIRLCRASVAAVDDIEAFCAEHGDPGGLPPRRLPLDGHHAGARRRLGWRPAPLRGARGRGLPPGRRGGGRAPGRL